MIRRGITDGRCLLSDGREATKDIGFVVDAFWAVVMGFVVGTFFAVVVGFVVVAFFAVVVGFVVGVAQRGEGVMIAQSIHANHAMRWAEGTRG